MVPFQIVPELESSLVATNGKISQRFRISRESKENLSCSYFIFLPQKQQFSIYCIDPWTDQIANMVKHLNKLTFMVALKVDQTIIAIKLASRTLLRIQNL